MRLVYGNTSFLFTGDILGACEKKLEEKALNLFSTILKVPHHGGTGSSTESFVGKVLPEIAVVSCRFFGKNTDLAESVVQIYSGFGAKVIRTDLSGAVEIKTDGIKYSVTCLKRQ